MTKRRQEVKGDGPLAKIRFLASFIQEAPGGKSETAIDVVPAAGPERRRRGQKTRTSFLRELPWGREYCKEEDARTEGRGARAVS